MSKYIFNWLTILMVAIVSIGFASCGGDDDDEKKSNEGELTAIIGTWMETQDSGTKLYLVLLANGHGSWEVEQSKGHIENDGEFTYTYKDNVITISYVDDNTVEKLYVIGLTADRLTIKYDDGGKHVFYRN